MAYFLGHPVKWKKSGAKQMVEEIGH